MTTEDIHKLVSLIEDVICQRVDIDEFEDIMPKVSQLMYNRYCNDRKRSVGFDTTGMSKKELETEYFIEEVVDDNSRSNKTR